MNAKYTCIIIDDEHHNRNALAKKIEITQLPLLIISQCESAEEGLKAIEDHKPDIVFLDIEMPMMSGIEMLKNIKRQSFQTIFTTAYNQYAIEAINLAALAYLLKPISIEELRNAILKAMEKVDDLSQQKKIDVLYELLHQNQLPQKLIIPLQNGVEIIDYNEIIYLAAEGNYTYIHLLDTKPVLSSKTLKEYEDTLPQSIFFRIHNSHIINLRYVRKLTKEDGMQVELKNGIKLDIARRRKDEFWERLLNKKS
ncbi:MAG TPA: LytTR family DNA-binding domain-containing protein [Saprospiraceae bacterium]|jgi:two-component system LytT family response regulator|nr:MAG: LytTR family two component transcriptional regulator [Candidatus Parvibacillus calidus]MBX2936896.1 response regulator transcription factor [Saprospiraceae bacterium]HNQ69505.1 LytTR family DNA-binding domain-containing protein [Bacteroidales bacterium]MBK7739811.1 response regulator transcription factor [Candidatus Parvibacillus calidus]MCB0591899.1 response regulator transcription factor [Saprospiraceae bacterium]